MWERPWNEIQDQHKSLTSLDTHSLQNVYSRILDIFYEQNELLKEIIDAIGENKKLIFPGIFFYNPSNRKSITLLKVPTNFLPNQFEDGMSQFKNVLDIKDDQTFLTLEQIERLPCNKKEHRHKIAAFIERCLLKCSLKEIMDHHPEALATVNEHSLRTIVGRIHYVFYNQNEVLKRVIEMIEKKEKLPFPPNFFNSGKDRVVKFGN